LKNTIKDRQLVSHITGGKEICLNLKEKEKEKPKIFLMALKYLI
jgi:hypothetical protein